MQLNHLVRAGIAIAFCLFALHEVLAIPTAAAASYPSRRITLVVPFPAGSATDAVTRRLAESIGAATSATVIVENKPGADGNLAALSVLKADADGYTVFVTTNSTQSANVNLFNSMPYDPARDFAPVAGIMTIPMMLTVRADFPAGSVAEFLVSGQSAQEAAVVREREHFKPGSRRAVSFSCRRRDAACSLPRNAASIDRRARRRDRLHFRRSCQRTRPGSGWPATRPGGDQQ